MLHAAARERERERERELGKEWREVPSRVRLREGPIGVRMLLPLNMTMITGRYGRSDPTMNAQL